MPRFGRSSRAPLAVACAGALFYAGCLPIPETVTLSPAVVGTLQRDDGTPVAGAPLALSTADNDSTCTQPTARTATDPAGRFEFAATRRREPVTVILFERLLCYNVCGGQTAADPMYRGCYLNSVPPDADSLSCVGPAAPAPGGGSRTSCVARDRRRRG